MTEDRDIAWAEGVIAAAEKGLYDDQLGISTDERALYTKAADASHVGGGGPLTLADVAELRRLGREDLIVAASAANRITIPNGDNA